MTGREIAVFAASQAGEKKAGDIVVYDLHGLSDVTDYFVIATAFSRLQIRAIFFAIEKGLKERGEYALGAEGEGECQWMLLDYADAVIHVFSPEMRAYYNLESLWGDAPKLEWNTTGVKKEAAPKPAAVGKPVKRQAKRKAKKK